MKALIILNDPPMAWSAATTPQRLYFSREGIARAVAVF
jgi:hypothetical protein